MKEDRSVHMGLGLVLAVYLCSAYWVWIRPGSDAKNRPITIRIAHWQLELGPADGIAAAIKRYEELNPHVRVKQMLVPSAGYPRWLRSQFAADNAPDIVEYGAWLGGLSDVPVLYFEPLTSHLEEPNPYNRGTSLEGLPWLKTFSDELLEQRMNSPEPGQYYAVTLTRGSYRFFCNRDLLRTITGSDFAPQTLAEFRDLWAQVAAYSRKRDRPVMPFAGSRENAWALMNIYMGGVTNGLSRELDQAGFMYIYPRQLLWSYLRGEWSSQRPE
ncbi:MAG: extracellular solute-binding protein, partial [Verrucomicrobia bacterium]|nr:extracellular solute-binding protein [Verrucomicrobiota bacterium]